MNEMTDFVPLAVCVYDNPATMQREAWQDGELLYAYSMQLLTLMEGGQAPWVKIFFGANVGPWRSGQIVGESRAIAIDHRPTHTLSPAN